MVWTECDGSSEREQLEGEFYWFIYSTNIFRIPTGQGTEHNNEQIEEYLSIMGHNILSWWVMTDTVSLAETRTRNEWKDEKDKEHKEWLGLLDSLGPTQMQIFKLTLK